MSMHIGVEFSSPKTEAGSLSMPGRQYNALKESLLDAQRRYQSLHEDLIGQSEANAELVRSLGMLKDANARLLDQLRYQNTQVEHITQLHLNAEEALDNMEKKHHRDVDNLKNEMRAVLESEKQSSGERVERLQSDYQVQLSDSRSKLEQARSDIRALEQQLTMEKQHFQQVEEALVQQVKQVESEIAQQLDAQAERFQSERSRVEEYLSKLQSELQQERQARTADLVEWSNKYALLVQDRDDLQCRLEREVAQLAAQLNSSERLLETERKAWSDERATLQKSYHDAITSQRASESSFKQSQQQITRIMQQLTEAESEARLKTEQVASLQRRVSDLEEEVNRSHSACTHLRLQIEEQHMRMREAKERELQQIRDHYEDKLKAARERAEDERHQFQTSLAQTQDELDRRTVEASSLRQSVEAAENDCNTLQRDLDLWRRTAEKSSIARQDVETELAQSKQLWSREKMNLEAMVEESRAEGSKLKTIVGDLQVELDHFKHISEARNTENKVRNAELEATGKQLANDINATRRDNLDLKHELEQTQQALEVERVRASEIVGQLERELALRTRKSDEDRQRFQATLDAEQLAASTAKQQFDLWRENHLQSLRKVQDEAGQQQSALERAKRRREDELMAQLGEQTQQLHNLQTRCDAAEAELSRSRTALQESRHQSEWMRQDQSEERKLLSEQNSNLRSKLQLLQNDLSELKRSEVAAVSAYQRLDQEKSLLVASQDDLRARCSSQVADAEARVTRQTQHAEREVQMAERRNTESLKQERRRLEELMRENEALRQYVTEHKLALVTAVSNTHRAIDSHVNAIQKHTTEQRSDLHNQLLLSGGHTSQVAGGGGVTAFNRPISVPNGLVLSNPRSPSVHRGSASPSIGNRSPIPSSAVGVTVVHHQQGQQPYISQSGMGSAGKTTTVEIVTPHARNIFSERR